MSFLLTSNREKRNMGALHIKTPSSPLAERIPLNRDAEHVRYCRCRRLFWFGTRQIPKGLLRAKGRRQPNLTKTVAHALM